MTAAKPKRVVVEMDDGSRLVHDLPAGYPLREVRIEFTDEPQWGRYHWITIPAPPHMPSCWRVEPGPPRWRCVVCEAAWTPQINGTWCGTEDSYKAHVWVPDAT